MILTDEEREQLIETHAQLASQGSQAVRRYWWSQMKNLIEGRSAAQVERMEREKGLKAA